MGSTLSCGWGVPPLWRGTQRPESGGKVSVCGGAESRLSATGLFDTTSAGSQSSQRVLAPDCPESPQVRFPRFVFRVATALMISGFQDVACPHHRGKMPFPLPSPVLGRGPVTGEKRVPDMTEVTRIRHVHAGDAPVAPQSRSSWDLRSAIQLRDRGARTTGDFPYQRPSPTEGKGRLCP